MGRDVKEVSRGVVWHSVTDTPTWDEIRSGALLRIADATELMAKNHAQLIAERDRYLWWYEQEQAASARLARSNAQLRGMVKRLKRGGAK